jgi:hypothetical protein
MSLFVLGCDASRDDPDDIAFLAMAMTYHQQAKFDAHAEEQKTILPFRMLVIIKLHAVVIEEHRPGFFKRYAMLSLVFAVLVLVPPECDLSHNDNVIIPSVTVKASSASFSSEMTFRSADRGGATAGIQTVQNNAGAKLSNMRGVWLNGRLFDHLS